VKTKAQIVQFLKDSYAYGHKAMAGLTAENQLEMMTAPFPGMPPMARGFIANLTIGTPSTLRQMAVYARMNGVIPPASAPPPARRREGKE